MQASGNAGDRVGRGGLVAPGRGPPRRRDAGRARVGDVHRGAALVAVPLAQHMRRRGRRPGLVMAYATAVVGAGLATTAGQVGSFPLFVVGLFLIGAGQAANLVGRYVAADLALPDRRARAISIVVWTGTLGAVLGPTFATFEKDAAGSAGFNRLIGPLVFSGAYFVLAALVVAVFMRPDPLVVAGGLAAAGEPRVRRMVQVRSRVRGDPPLPGRPPRPDRRRDLADDDGRGHDDDPAPHARPRPGRPVGVRHRPPHRRHVRPRSRSSGSPPIASGGSGSSRPAPRSSAWAPWSRSSPATTRPSSSPGCSSSAWGGAAA